MGSGSSTVEMMTHNKALLLLLLLLGVTVVDIRGQSVVFPSNADDAVVSEPTYPSLPMRWKRLNRLRNIWSERDNNGTRGSGMVKPMDNEVEWGTEIFQTMSLRMSAEASGEPSPQKWGRTRTTSRGTWCR